MEGVEITVAQNFFTLKLNSEAQLRRLSIGGEFGDRVVVEGVLGRIVRLDDFEGTLVRIEFEGGQLSLDVALRDIVKLLKKQEKNRLERKGRQQDSGSLV